MSNRKWNGVIQRFTGKKLADGTRETTTRYKDWVRSITTTSSRGGGIVMTGGRHAAKSPLRVRRARRRRAS